MVELKVVIKTKYIPVAEPTVGCTPKYIKAMQKIPPGAIPQKAAEKEPMKEMMSI